MDRAAHYLPVLSKNDFNVSLGHYGCVEVSDEDTRVEGTWVILVRYVAGQSLSCHPSRGAAQPSGRQMERKTVLIIDTHLKPTDL